MKLFFLVVTTVRWLRTKESLSAHQRFNRSQFTRIRLGGFCSASRWVCCCCLTSVQNCSKHVTGRFCGRMCHTGMSNPVWRPPMRKNGRMITRPLFWCHHRSHSRLAIRLSRWRLYWWFFFLSSRMPALSKHCRCSLLNTEARYYHPPSVMINIISMTWTRMVRYCCCHVESGGIDWFRVVAMS